MTLQEIVRMQNARNQAYRADIDQIVRYGNGSLLADTLIVVLHKKFAGGQWLHTQLELPLAITIGELLQLLADLQPDHCSDEDILEKLEPYFTAQITDAWSRDTQLLEYLTSDQGSQIVFYPEDTPTDEDGWPALPDGCTGFISLPVLYPSSEEIITLDIPAEATLENAASFILSAGIAVNTAFSADITPFC